MKTALFCLLSLLAATSRGVTLDPQPINVAAVANTYAIATDGKAVTPTGMDGYSSAFLLSTVQALGFGKPDVLDAVKATTVPLPAVSASTLTLKAIAVDGNQVNQTFTVNYTDGSVSVFTQSLSNWWYSAKYPGETILATFPDFERGAGVYKQAVNVYAYTFTVNPAKVLRSLTLPLNNNVILLAGSVQPTQVPSTYDTVYLSWPVPTKNTNGTAASIASYNVYKGTGQPLALYASTTAPDFADPLSCGSPVFYSVTAVSTQGIEGAQSPPVGKSCTLN